MSGVRDWLRSNNLEHYADAFEANDIDLDILPELSEQDFERLGVSLGNRRRLLKAIAAANAAPAIPPPSAAGPSPPSGDAERRQVTVMFCDMVGSTALSGTLDPELLGTFIRRYQDAAAGAIGRFGGFVAKFMGDGVLAYFGFPQAFEDAAERAVRAAIGILAEVGAIELPDGTPVAARVGIATGLVVIGEVLGTGMAQERTIVGETPNLAARLQALAEPNTILVSESTQNLLGGLFKLDPIGTHDLKGFARPVPAWRVVGEAEAVSRFAAIRTGDSVPLVGRAHEMGLLGDRWQLACSGESQIVTVIGEAGIGKSRALEALQDTIAGEAHGLIHLQCSPYHTDSALYPVIAHMARTAGFGAADSPGARLEKLGALFSQRAALDPAAIPLLAALLSIPDAPVGAEPQTPAQRKAATIALLVDEIVRLGEAKPMLLIVEDAHWIDATTLEMLTRISDSTAQARLLVVVTARPDFSAPWLARPHSTLLTLGRLSRSECAELVNSVAAAHGLTAETIAAIVAKTDGVPLFAEELTRSVVESAGEDAGAVPATLKDSLMARLDRLGAAREIAQVAAVIGRQFDLPLLTAVVSKDGPDLESALSKLVASGIVFPAGRGGEQNFNFKHALVRDAAYESLLLGRRREWHERIARTLEQSFGERVANEPELLAYHFGEAGLAGLACDYSLRAGERAVSRSAYHEAIANFSAGLKWAGTLTDTAERERRQLNLLLKQGPALMVLRGVQSTAAEEVYRRAAEIGESLGDDEGSYKAKWGLWLHANLGRKTALARDRARELVTLAQHSGDGDLLLEAYHCRWSTAFFRGDAVASLDDSRIGIATYDIARHRHLGHAFGGHDPGVCAYANCALSLQMSGDRKEAQDNIVRGLTLAEALDHPNSLAHALYEASLFHQLVGDRQATLEVALRTAALSEKFGLLPYRSGSLMLVGWARTEETGFAAAAAVIEAEVDSATAVGPIPQYNLGLAGETLLAAGRPADGLAYLDRAIAAIDEPGIGFYLPEIYRLRGECLLALDRRNKGQARQAFTTARDIANRQGASIFERRAEAALAEMTTN